MVSILIGDNRVALKTLPDNSVDSVVTDPPYELGFMSKGWDKSGIANDVTLWREVLRVLKPGGYLLAFSGSRTYHRMVCAIEDAGFEVRDQIMWLYGSGFPKSHDVSKDFDKAAGVVGTRGALKLGGERLIDHETRDGEGRWGDESVRNAYTTVASSEMGRRWQGWGTALKPAHEPICVARKPLIGTVVANVAEYGTGAINIDGCRVPGEKPQVVQGINTDPSSFGVATIRQLSGPTDEGRWPANVIHDGSPEVVDGFPHTKGGTFSGHRKSPKTKNVFGKFELRDERAHVTEPGSAARFFYCAKASKADREEGLDDLPGVLRTDGREKAVQHPKLRMTERKNHHPTVKPTDLMRYLCRLVTPPGGVVLDPFMGSGSTGRAAVLEGFGFVGCELQPEYVEIAKRRIDAVDPLAQLIKECDAL